MFEQVTLLLSFVYALALTHLLASVTELTLARDRVRFSGLHALWMGIALVVLFNNWLQAHALKDIRRWTLPEEALQFAWAMAQYFTCSLVSIRVEPGAAVDMEAFHARQRPAIMIAFASLTVMAMLGNYLDRSGPDWIGQDLLNLPMLALIGVAGVARAKWLQWAAGVGVLALVLGFLTVYPPQG